ncbi:MAG: hypothetical protein RIQ93_771 [Verrucomicrobiota bacterium]|jgi:hypothetical protein
MFPNLLALVTSRPSPDADRTAFVNAVHVEERELPNPRVERRILICWVLIAVKHVAIIWAVRHYPVPFHQLWVNFPTWVLGTLATGIYYWQVRKSSRRDPR